MSGKKKRVKAGADVVSVGGGAFFVTKGNKTNECWRVVLQKSKQDGVTDAQASNGSVRLTIGPNPLRAGFATIRLSGQAPLGYEIPAKVSMYDAAGRLVLHSSFDNRTSSLPLDLQHLSAGVYLLRLEHKGGCIDRKLVVVSQ
ncbi:MAG: T9SS type A sorting domain-containing protein [candidate division WOR-3 bacterium]